jgi:hypothetical protein
LVPILAIASVVALLGGIVLAVMVVWLWLRGRGLERDQKQGEEN